MFWSTHWGFKLIRRILHTCRPSLPSAAARVFLSLRRSSLSTSRPRTGSSRSFQTWKSFTGRLSFLTNEVRNLLCPGFTSPAIVKTILVKIYRFDLTGIWRSQLSSVAMVESIARFTDSRWLGKSEAKKMPFRPISRFSLQIRRNLMIRFRILIIFCISIAQLLNESIKLKTCV